MKISCSSCNQRLEIPEELAGQTIECPACKGSLAVPNLAAPPSPTPQVEVVTPQATAPQKSVPKRKAPAAPKAASPTGNKKLLKILVVVAGLGVFALIAERLGLSIVAKLLAVLVAAQILFPQLVPFPWNNR